MSELPKIDVLQRHRQMDKSDSLKREREREDKKEEKKNNYSILFFQ